MDANTIIIIISITTGIGGFIFGYIRTNRDKTKDVTMTVKEKTEYQMRLEYLEKRVTHVEDKLIQELKQEISLLRADIRNILDRIIDAGKKA